MAKILIARLGAMGDILHALPAVTAIRAVLPEATIGWIVEEGWSELLTARGPKTAALSPQRPVVNLIHTVNTKRWRAHVLHSSSRAELGGALKRLREVGYELALDFQGAFKSALLARCSGATTIAGFADPREPLARAFYQRKFARAGDHVVEQNHALAVAALEGQNNASGHPFKLVPPCLPCDPAGEAWAQGEIRRLGLGSFALIAAGGGWGAKCWPAERFGHVARALARHNLKTLVNAGPGEETLARNVVEASGGHAFVVNCTLGELIALTRRARIVIGGDTGPLHLAAALGVPVVGVFGPTDPVRTGPFGAQAISLRHPDSRTTFAHRNEPDPGMLQITADEVMGAARHLLGGGRG